MNNKILLSILVIIVMLIGFEIIFVFILPKKSIIVPTTTTFTKSVKQTEQYNLINSTGLQNVYTKKQGNSLLVSNVPSDNSQTVAWYYLVDTKDEFLPHSDFQVKIGLQSSTPFTTMAIRLVNGTPFKADANGKIADSLAIGINSFGNLFAKLYSQTNPGEYIPKDILGEQSYVKAPKSGNLRIAISNIGKNSEVLTIYDADANKQIGSYPLSKSYFADQLLHFTFDLRNEAMTPEMLQQHKVTHVSMSISSFSIHFN